jgi:hypothetical protein
VPSLAISVYALWKMFTDLSRITGLKFEELLHVPEEKK